MRTEQFIPIDLLSLHYEEEAAFIDALCEAGFIEITVLEQRRYVHQDQVAHFERAMRLHRDLDVNLEGIEIVLGLLKRIEGLQNELHEVKSRLRRYER